MVITLKEKLIKISFFLVLISMNYFIGTFNALPKRPESVHMWAMCDRASIARNYAEESMNFFKPRVHETKELKGITGLEFPIMNYMAAICYKIFGFNEFWYRLLMLLSISVGVFAAYNFTVVLLKNYLVAGLIILIWYLTPVLNYYSASFIPDTASLGFILISWYYFFKWQHSGLKQNIVLYFLFGTVACLTKITSLISITVMIAILIIDHLRLLDINKQRLFEPKKMFVSLSFIIFLLVFAWYKYASWLSVHNNGGVFLMGTNMVDNQAKFDDSWNGIKNVWIPIYYPKSIYWLMCGCVVLLLVYVKRVNRLLGLITLGLWCGNICFIYLMFNQFKNHDYYIITLLPAILFLFIATTDLILKLKSNRLVSGILITCLLTLIFTGSIFSRNHQQFRYNPDGWLYYGKDLRYYQTVEPYLRTLGIKRTDKVVSIADDSPNIALYLMNVKGWHINRTTSDEEIINAIRKGAKYFIINDSLQARREKIKPLLKDKMGEYYNIQIFSFKEIK